MDTAGLMMPHDNLEGNGEQIGCQRGGIPARRTTLILTTSPKRRSTETVTEKHRNGAVGHEGTGGPNYYPGLARAKTKHARVAQRISFRPLNHATATSEFIAFPELSARLPR